MSGQRTQWNEATRVQMPALVHLTRIGFTYFGKITEDKAGTVYDPDTNILIEVFKSQFAKLNPERAGEAEAMLRIIRQELDNDDIGESFYKRLKAVSPVRLIDFEHPENNTFHCSAEFTCKRDEDEFRPDITLFVNGLPLVFIEVKKPNNIGGMVAEAERMNKLRFPNKKFRRFINITQLMIFSNNMEYDAMGGIVPIQGAVKREQQDRIAGILGAIDKKISTNNAINDNLAQQLRLLYDYWFTQFDFPDESGKPYRSSGGQMVWSDDAKKEIPASWNSTKMSDAIEGIRTGLNPRDNFKLGSGTIKYITVKNLRSDGILDFSGCDTIDETARAIVHRRSDVCTGDILFASIAPLGRCHLVQELPQDWDINESVFSIRCNKATVTPEYLYMHLQSEAFVKESTACSTGSVFKGIRINTLLDSRVFLPPMQVIEKFSQQTKPLFSLQYKLNKEIQALTQLRDWLLPMLMNGQATVSD